MSETGSDAEARGEAIARGRFAAEHGGESAELRETDRVWQPIYEAMTGTPGQPSVHQVDPAAGTVLIEALQPESLSEVGGPIPHHAIAYIGVRMASALATLPVWPEPLTAGHIGLDAKGHPVLAPQYSGDEAAEPPTASLEGLGAVLYELATGTPPGHSPAPPHALRPGLPSDLSEAIIGLLSPDATARGAAAGQLARLAQPTDLRPYIGASSFQRATMDSGQVKVTTTGKTQSRARLDIPTPKAAVVIEHDTLAGLPPAALSHLAGAAELPLAAVEDAIEAGRPLVITALMSKASLTSATAAQQRALQMPLSSYTGPGFSRALEVLFLGGAGVLAALFALFASSVGMALVALVAFGMTLVSIYGGFRNARQMAAARQAHEIQERARQSAPDWLDGVADRRRRLAEADLPEPVERDAREVLEAIEHAESQREAERALTALDELLAPEAEESADPAERAERLASLARRSLREAQ